MAKSSSNESLKLPFQTQLRSLTEADNKNATQRAAGSQNHLLPASHRVKYDDVDDVEPASLTTEFLRREFGVQRLNEVHDWLWLTGRPMPPRPLYYQKAVRRDIVIHEQMDLHLVWNSKRMFLKPIPRYLLDKEFWHNNLSCECKCACESENQHTTPSASSHASTPGTEEAPICERREIYQSALGFMLSYASLISYESDFHIAKASNLVPVELTWSDWRILVKELLTQENKRNINKRYIYGELRLDRLNLVYQCTLRSPIRGYLYGYRSYNQFWHDNLARIVSLFAYIVIVLTAMQVGLATTDLQTNETFQRASYGFAVFSILSPLIFIGLVLIIFLVLFVLNLLATLQYNKKKLVALHSSGTANTS